VIAKRNNSNWEIYVRNSMWFGRRISRIDLILKSVLETKLIDKIDKKTHKNEEFSNALNSVFENPSYLCLPVVRYFLHDLTCVTITVCRTLPHLFVMFFHVLPHLSSSRTCTGW
jgi:hypothetical protein